MRLANHQVATLQSVLVGVYREFLHRVLLHQILRHRHHVSEGVQLRTVVVGIGEGELQDEARHGSLLVVACHAECVFGHEDVGRDAATAVHRATDAGVISRTLMLYAVLREELAVLISRYDVALVVLGVARRERLLYATTRRGVVACDGEAYHRAVGEANLLLNKTLAERTATDDGAAVVVLYGSGEDLGCRRRALVDKHAERQLLIRAVTVGTEVLTRRLAALHIHYELVLRQELVSHLHGRVHVSARIVAQVDDQVLEAFLRELSQRDEHLGISSLAEASHLYIARVLVEHICRSDALLRYVATCDGEVFHGFLSVAHHAELHLRVLRTLQSAHSLLVGHYLAYERFAVDAHNLVAGDDASALSRSVLHHVLHADGVLAYGELDAHARERTLQVVGHSLRILSRDIDGVGVEVGKNLRNGDVDERVDVYLVHILVVDDVQQVRESVRTRVDDIQSVAREMVCVERANEYARYHAESHYQRHEPIRFLCVHNRLDLDILLLC